MVSRFIYNIQGCITKYQDFDTPRSWFDRGQKELGQTAFNELLDTLLHWFVEAKSLHSYAECMVDLFEEVSPGLGMKLQEELHRAQEAEAEAREALEQKLREQQDKALWDAAQEESRKKRERERLAAIEEARQEKELQERIELEQHQQRAIAFVKRKKQLLVDLHAYFLNDFLTCEDFYRQHCATHITADEFAAERRHFVKKWFFENGVVEDGKKQQLPDEEQLEAIAAMDKEIQVIARAGSGKTSTIVNRALFLIKHCKIHSGRMLLLAFNKKAALEIRKRLLLGLIENGELIYRKAKKDAIERKTAYKPDSIQFDENLINSISSKCGIILPHAMTFHALARAIVSPEEELLYDGEDEKDQKLSRAMQDIIDKYIRSPEKHDQVRRLMLEHFKSDWDRIASGGYDKSREELLIYRRSLPHETLGEEFVKSYGEKLIANFLFEHGIPYKYEKNHRWNGTNYRPDFTIANVIKQDIVIEYFGLEGDPDYDQMSQEKRKYWSGQSGYIFLEFTPKDIARGGEKGFYELIKRRLARCGIHRSMLSEDEIWEKVKKRSIDRFTKAIVNFVGRCRQRLLSPTALQNEILRYNPIHSAEEKFLKLAVCIYEDYLNRLLDNEEDDFCGWLHRAAIAIASGQTRFARKSGAGDIGILSHVFIDEFQDFSKLFFELLNSIRIRNPNVRLFCVGDDWQAINRFAGSDLQYFESFSNFFKQSRLLHISTNYRSSQPIVELGNALMHGKGKHANSNKQEPGMVLLCDIGIFAPTYSEEKCHAGDLLTPALLRILDKSFQQDKRIVLLSHTNSIPWYINYPIGTRQYEKDLVRYLCYLRTLLPENFRPRISISTAHKYKGLERDTVILIDVVSRCYPLIHPNSIFTRILGDSPDSLIQDDRRLLYVAMTRAIHTLYILTDKQKPSPFLKEIEGHVHLNDIDWRQYPSTINNKFLFVTVRNQPHRGSFPTLSIRDDLKALDYKWRSDKNCWLKSIPKGDFSISVVNSECWASTGDGLEVSILDDQEVCLASYHVNRGQWTKIV